MVKKLRALIDGGFKGKQVAVLGLSFKPQTNDIRESPAIDMINALQSEGAFVKAYDPVAMDEMRRKFPDIQYLDSWEAAVEASHALVIMTDWNEFRGLNIVKLKTLMAQPIVLDTRNVLSMEELRTHGFKFDNVGRHGKGGKW
jgi:UDPglucose 6-dehydrogenase